MIKLNERDGLLLEFKNKIVFSHNEENCFAQAVKWDLAYQSKRGSFKVKQKIIDKIPLNSYEVIKKEDKEIIIKFHNKDIFCTIKAKEINGILYIYFDASEAYSWQLNLDSNQSNAVFGGGEQFRKLNLMGEIVENLVSEHITLKPILEKGLLNFKKYKEKEHKDLQTYAPMSTFVMDSMFAIRIHVLSFGTQDFSNRDIMKFLYYKCPDKIIYVVEDTYEKIGQKLSVDTPNKQYLPEWCHDGMILGVQGGIERVMKKAFYMLDKGAKVSGVWCQDWSGKKKTIAGSQVYWNWEVDDVTYPDLKNNIRKLKERDVRFLAYINPYLIVEGNLYNQCKEKGYLIKNKKGGVYHVVSTTFEFGMMDLTNPGMVKFLKDTIIKKNMLDLGIEGYMADFGEYLPVDCQLYDNNAEEMHNYWPVLWAKINREAIKEAGKEKDIFFFTRSGYNEAESFTPIMWNGDQHTDYTKDYGLPSIIPATLNLGFSGMNIVHSDIGGFTSFRKLKRDEELFIRWMEINTFSPLMRSHETIRPEANIQYDAENVIKHTIRLTNIHQKLKPYIIKCLEDANKGKMVMRPDFYHSNDYSKHKDMYSYFFGDDIYVAAVIEKNAIKRQVHLPEGKWMHIMTKKLYNGGEYELDCPLGQPLSFVRYGSYCQELLDK